MSPISNRAAEVVALRSLAARQEGPATRRQLEACGISASRLKGWLRDDRLHPVFPAVFTLGQASLEPKARMRAAALACPGAVVSHRNAAVLLRIGEVAPVVVDLIPAEQGGRKIDGIKAHRVPFPDPHERVLFDGIPCTSVARTIVDLAGTHGEAKLRETSRWQRCAEARPHGDRRDPCLRSAAARGSLPPPHPRRLATGGRDGEAERERFVVEADSRKFHAIETAFERDHRRSRELMAAHYGVLPASWRETEREPEAVFAVIRAELKRRRKPSTDAKHR